MMLAAQQKQSNSAEGQRSGKRNGVQASGLDLLMAVVSGHGAKYPESTVDRNIPTNGNNRLGC